MLQPKALYEMAEAAKDKFGVIDVLINNAGIQHVSSIEEFPAEKWDAIIGINLTSAFHLTKAVWPGMKNQQFGRIINIASIHGLFASEYKSAYVAAKHGLVGFTTTAALEGAGCGITCNAICPGYVKNTVGSEAGCRPGKSSSSSRKRSNSKSNSGKTGNKRIYPCRNNCGFVCISCI